MAGNVTVAAITSQLLRQGLEGGQQWLIEHAAAQCTVWRFFFRAAKTHLRAAGQAQAASRSWT